MFFSLPSRVAPSLAAAAFLVAMAAGRAEAQFGIGAAYPGVPFLFYTPERVPSPTDYLYDRDQARISAYGNAVQQQAAASQSASPSSNAYFNRLRDYSGEETYQVSSRQSLSRRAAPPARPRSSTSTRPASTRSTTRSDSLPLEAFFLPGDALDWPRDAPISGTLRSAKAEVDASVKVVLDEVRSGGKVKAQSVGAAKSKLVAYGNPALGEIRSGRSKAVADCFHYFLLFLHQALDQAAEANGS